MADQPPLYDLTLLLSADAPEEQRARILSAVENSVTSSGGSVERNDDWGRRPMAYEIKHRPEADYHLLQFYAPASAIEELSHTLRITDGVVRFRIIKVKRGTPPLKAGAPPVVAAVASSSSGSSSSDGGSRSGPGREASPPADAEQAASAEAPDSAPAAAAAPAAAGETQEAADGDSGSSE